MDLPELAGMTVKSHAVYSNTLAVGVRIETQRAGLCIRLAGEAEAAAAEQRLGYLSYLCLLQQGRTLGLKNYVNITIKK